MVIARKGLTLEEFLRLPEREPALEFAEGEVTQKVSPQGQHSAIQSEFIERINTFGRRRRLARAFSELRTTFAGRSRVPDVAVYRWDRIPTDRAGRVPNVVTEPPGLAIEIVSPGQRVNPLVRRCLWYVTNGVAVALLVDPDDESVLAFRPGQATTALRGPVRIDLEEVLPGFQLIAEE